MADNETIAAILASGMLHPISPPSAGSDGIIEQDEQVRFITDVLHAVGLYRAVLEAIGNPPKTHRICLDEIESRPELPITNFRDRPSGGHRT